MTSPRAVRSLLALLALLALPASPALAAWPHDPSGPGLPLRPDQLVAFTPSVCEDGTGGYFVAWDENNVIFVQHVNAAGRLLWGSGAVAVASLPSSRFYPAICPDGSGGAIVAWQDNRAGNPDVYAQRVNAAGAEQWTLNGVALCSATGTQSGVRIAADGAGAAVVVWLDTRSGFTRVFARGVSAAGVPQWAEDGVEVTPGTGGNQADPQIVWLPAGSYALAWQDLRTGFGDLYAQLLAPDGTLFAASGIAVCTAAGNQSAARLCKDAGSGFAIAWVDERGADADIYAQRVNALGSRLWVLDGVVVCAAATIQDKPSISPDPTGGLFVSWQDWRNAATSELDLYAQRLSASGAPLWAANGVVVCAATGAQVNVRSLPDGAGGALLAWADYRKADASDVDLYAQRLGPAGTPLWNAGGVPVNVSNQRLQTPAPFLCTDGRGGMNLAWVGAPPIGSTFRTYGARVDEWGYLGAEPAIASARDVPNDQGGQVKLSWYASPLDTDPLFRNVSTYLAYRSLPPNVAQAAARRAGAAVVSPAEAAGAATPPRWLRTRFAATDYFWELAASVTAMHLGQYSVTVATAGDSIGGSNPLTAFMVMAMNGDGTNWWISEPDSGYSVDDLAPAAPAPFTGQYAAGSAALHWNPNSEPDLAGYELHRGGSPAFVPGAASFVAALADTGYVDAAGGPFVYKLVALDVHGNRSPVATLVPSGTLGVADGGTAAYFAAPSPNPARTGALLRFALATAGPVELALFDAQGRRVRTLAGARFETGEHAIAFDGRDDAGRRLAPGLYLARLVAPGIAATRRLALVD